MTLHSEENKKKEVYSEPILIKHGALLDITAAFSGGVPPEIILPVYESENGNVTAGFGTTGTSGIPPLPVNQGGPSENGVGFNVNIKF